MIAIGTPVQATTDDFTGIVTRHKGAPQGRIDHEVTTVEPLPKRRTYPEHELTPLDIEPATYPVDSEVYVHGQDCLVIEFDPENDCYELVSVYTLPSNVQVGHLYPAVPGFKIRLWQAGKRA